MIEGLVFTRNNWPYLYYAICISKRICVSLSKRASLLRITKGVTKLPHVWVSCLLRTVESPCDPGTCLLKPFALIAPDACVVTCGYRLHSEIISRSHLLIRQIQVSYSVKDICQSTYLAFGIPEHVLQL